MRSFSTSKRNCIPLIPLLAAAFVFFVIALLPPLYIYVDALFPEVLKVIKNDSAFTNQTGQMDQMRLLPDVRQLRLLWHSLLIAGATALFSVVLGAPLAFLVARTDLPFRRILGAIYLIPLVIPAYITAIGWTQLLGKRQEGVGFASLAEIWGIKEPPFTVYGLGGAIFVLTLTHFPYATLLTLSCLNSMDERLEEAARVCAPPRRVFWGISLPLAAPSILSASVLVFVFAISNFGVPSVMLVNTLATEIFVQFSAFFNFPIAAALSLPLLATTLLFILFQRFYLSGKSYTTISSHSRQAKPIELKAWKYPALFFCLLVILLAVIAPVSTLIIRSASWLAYQTAFQAAGEGLINSLLYAALGSTIITVLSLLLSYAIERRLVLGATIWNLAPFFPFAVPSTVVGIGLIRIWDRRGLFNLIYGTPLIVLFGYIARFTPFALSAVSTAIKQVHFSLEEVARLSGIRWNSIFTQILLPLIRPGLTAAWGLSFILCLGELETTLLVCPPGQAMLPIVFFNLLHGASAEVVAALAMLLIVSSLTAFFLFYGFYAIARKLSPHWFAGS